ncbi:hypothetical protein K438DRAFT_1996402 [Mycena galopus ATCC 62051]|nr:hypothetical protein K438DRAFT_1996402 [Mycena galopus ATCC 62051]
MAPKFSFLQKLRLHKLRRSFNASSSIIPSQCPPSYLLSLPCELRLQIYDALPLDCQVRRPTRYTRSACEPPLALPWLALMLVCKTIADELRNHVRASANTTCHLEVDNVMDWESGDLSAVAWRQIPCPPSSVHTLQAELVFSLASHVSVCCWNEGYGRPILDDVDLCSVLNHFIHNGPLLIRRRPLREHIHLDTLIFQLRIIEGAPGVLERYDGVSLKKQIRGEFEQYISRLVEQGLLFGAVDKVVCRFADGGGAEIKWDVCRKPIDITQRTQYGFAWGVAGSSSLRPELKRKKRLW